MIRSARIVGSGLIGTSIGLCLKSAGVEVEMVDIDLKSAQLAQDLVKSTPIEQPDLILVAVPISSNQRVVIEQLKANPNSIVCDLASVKSDLSVKVEQLSDNPENFISLHPMAGREHSGAQNARGDLFMGRAWVVITGSKSSDKARSIADALIKICEGSSYQMNGTEHDLAVAQVSHLPQILSSALAASLLEVSDDKLNISGQGIRDLTRLANSDSKLWSEILLANQPALSTVLSKIISQLQEIQTFLVKNKKEEVIDFLNKGREGKEKIPGKHGAKSRNYSYLPIVIDDKPGQLAIIFNECAKIDVNIEDLSIEHSPGQETGLITLSLSEVDNVKLSEHLEKLGFKVHPSKNR